MRLKDLFRFRHNSTTPVGTAHSSSAERPALKKLLEHLEIPIVILTGVVLAFVDIRFGHATAIYIAIIVLAPVSIHIAIGLSRRTSLPKEIGQLLPLINEASDQPHPILSAYRSNLLVDLKHEMEKINSGRIDMEVSSLSELSITAMKFVDRECKLIFIPEESEELLAGRGGKAKQHYDEMLKAHSRIRMHSDKEEDGVTRIFMLQRSKDISPLLFEFIRRNDKDIRVRIVFDDQLSNVERPPQIEDLDFGYYQVKSGYKWTMILKRLEGPKQLTNMVVETNEHIADLYKIFADEIDGISMPFSRFEREHILTPMNDGLWEMYFATHAFQMKSPHGLSANDANTIVEQLKSSLAGRDVSTTRILVLGRTPLLLKRLLEEGFARIISLDALPNQPEGFEGKVDFKQGNWLNVTTEDSFGGIVFDEALNNLSRLQLNLFFPELRRVLESGSHVIGRIMGRYDQERESLYRTITETRAIAKLREVNGKSHEEIAPLVICLLHAVKFGFDVKSMTVNCQTWNEVLRQMLLDGAITEAEYKCWRLPFGFRLLSPDEKTLTGEAKQSGFNLMQRREVSIDTTADSDIFSFFQIFDFQYRP